MAIPTFTNVALPQDMQIADATGRITPAWHRVFQALIQLLPNTGSATTQLEASIASSVATLTVSIDADEARITALEANLDQAAIADSPVTTLAVSVTHVQAEIQAIETRLRDTNTAFNTLLSRLRAANILEP